MKYLIILFFTTLIACISCQHNKPINEGSKIDNALDSLIKQDCPSYHALQSNIIDTIYADVYNDSMVSLYTKLRVSEIMKPDYEEALNENLELYNNATELANNQQQSVRKDEASRIANIHKRLINDYRLKLSEIDSLQNMYDEMNDLYFKYLNNNDTVLFYEVAFTYSCNGSEHTDTALLDSDFMMK
jgi:hypothetical protein